MPELPEVETLRRDLERTLVGRTFVSAEARIPRLFVEPRGPEQLVGREVLALQRRAKFLIWELSDQLVMVMHLKLAGQIIHRDARGQTIASGGHPVPAFHAPMPHKQTNATFSFDDKSTVYMTDIRQFARVRILTSAELAPFLGTYQLGPEPLTRAFSARALATGLARHPRLAVKPALLDQRTVAGLGNIYVDESLWLARIHPERLAGLLSDLEIRRLARAIRSVIGHAVNHGVAEILNGRATPDHDFPRVHGRAGGRCPRCRREIAKMRVAGRGTYVCARCQPRVLTASA
ncbi:MAG: bifunctional DNA-formamidopyrimidine glycosylase/DNA-(apurinic or apyrimidinic site) lyase [Chloroflexota bacterium]